MSSYTYPVFGLIHAPAGTHTSGMTLSQRSADNSVERANFTVTGSASGQLEYDVTRHMGIHTSVSHMVATGSLGPNVTSTERKIFFLDSDRNLSSGFSDWNIFDSNGASVGAGAGTTDVDVTPMATGLTNE